MANQRYNTKGRPLGSLEERFWSKINKESQDDCWNWTGATSCSGYGVLQKGSRGEGLIRTHRFSYEIHKGQIPSKMLILHSCDNKLCCNPAHLSIGDHSKNIKEAWDRGRRKLSHWNLKGFADSTRKTAR